MSFITVPFLASIYTGSTVTAIPLVRDDPCFQMGGIGLEPTRHPSEKPGVANASGAECGALVAHSPPFDPDLAAVADAWPELPAAIKAGILALIGATK
jgi:hypothetical protein